jgi:hypothetical protein
MTDLNLNPLAICSIVFISFAIFFWVVYIAIIKIIGVSDPTQVPYADGIRKYSCIGALLFTFGTFICVVFNRSNWGIPGSIGNWYNIYCLTGIIISGIGIIFLILTFGPEIIQPNFVKDHPIAIRFLSSLLTITGCWLLLAPDLTPSECST